MVKDGGGSEGSETTSKQLATQYGSCQARGGRRASCMSLMSSHAARSLANDGLLGFGSTVSACRSTLEFGRVIEDIGGRPCGRSITDYPLSRGSEVEAGQLIEVGGGVSRMGT
jgi:hypothetical protein